MEYLLALIPALAWGSIGIITAKMGGSTEQQTLGSMTGFMIFALVIYFITKPAIDVGSFIVGIISGLLLAAANFGQFDAMTELGVSRAVPLVASGQLTLNTLVGALIFGEWNSLNKWIVGSIALVVIIYGAKLTSFSEDEDGAYSRKGLRGVLIAILGGAFYAIVPKAYQYFMHIDAGTSFTYGIMIPQAIGGLMGAFLIYYVREKKNPMLEYKSAYPWKNTTVGFAWAIGNIFMLRASMGPIGLATAFTLSQLNLVVGGVGGILILKEKKTKAEMKYFILGLGLVIVGAVTTGML